MKHLWIAAAALFAMPPGPVAAQAQGTVPPWEPIALIDGAARGPLPIVLDKDFYARQENSRPKLEQLSANPEAGALPPVMRKAVPGVRSEKLPPPKR
jgi:hypothetical protein